MPIPQETAPIGEAGNCLRCGYNLRGLPIDGVCPECGLGILRSVRREELYYSDPRWIRRLRAGVWLLLLSQVAVIGMFIGSSNGYAASTGIDVALGVVTCLNATGIWLLTSREDRWERRRPGNRLRLALRQWVFIAPLLALGMGFALHIAQTGQLPGAFPIICNSILVGMSLDFALIFFYLRRLAVRVLNPSLAEHCKIVGIGLPSSVFLPIALQFQPSKADLSYFVAEAAVVITLLLFLLGST